MIVLVTFNMKGFKVNLEISSQCIKSKSPIVIKSYNFKVILSQNSVQTLQTLFLFHTIIVKSLYH